MRSYLASAGESNAPMTLILDQPNVVFGVTCPVIEVHSPLMPTVYFHSPLERFHWKILTIPLTKSCSSLKQTTSVVSSLGEFPLVLLAAPEVPLDGFPTMLLPAPLPERNTPMLLKPPGTPLPEMTLRSPAVVPPIVFDAVET